MKNELIRKIELIISMMPDADKCSTTIEKFSLSNFEDLLSYVNSVDDEDSYKEKYDRVILKLRESDNLLRKTNNLTELWLVISNRLSTLSKYADAVVNSTVKTCEDIVKLNPSKKVLAKINSIVGDIEMYSDMDGIASKEFQEKSSSIIDNDIEYSNHLEEKIEKSEEMTKKESEINEFIDEIINDCDFSDIDEVIEIINEKIKHKFKNVEVTKTSGNILKVSIKN